MKKLSVYKKSYHVDYCDSDYYKKLKLSALFNYFQDIAGLHAENLALGIDFLQEKHNVTWVMVRIMVDIERIPTLKEDISIETWPLEPKKLEFERDFIVKDVVGNVLIRATSSWVIMDIEKREIRKAELISDEFPVFLEQRAIERRMGKPRPNGEPGFVYNKKIGYSDIDINGHLNNSKYIDYISDCFSLEVHGKYSVKSLQVNYISEALAGENILFYKDISISETGEIYVEGSDEDKAKTYFKALITIK